jgi:hypothetical protein
MKKIQEISSNQEKNHIYPFLWLHGIENESTIREEIERMSESGIGGLCIEARPHKYYLQKKWWADLDSVMDECRSRDMKVWLLDDSHFPTGYCNGEIMNHPELRKRYLNLKVYDYFGPTECGTILLNHCLNDKDDIIEAAVLVKRTGWMEIEAQSAIDLTDQIISKSMPNGEDIKMINLDLPEGKWSIYIFVESYLGGETETKFHLDPMNPAAVKKLLDTIYEPHYEHYKNDFGKTFLGFFSDEPRFGNFHGENSSIGRNPEMVLPWNRSMMQLLGQKLGVCQNKIRTHLPLLFVGDFKNDMGIRCAYMDTVSRLYSENFDGQISRWCHNHGCMHIGHTIEDNNSSSRLGYGAGHFFRAMQSQDMAGMDIIEHQLMPGMDDSYYHARHKAGWDGEFFNYLLPKMTSSLAAYQPVMQGRAMCELFGAYGWHEGNRLCKWIADLLLVNGINEFVPHSFDPAPFPDTDCPPHFYAHGNNPQYPEFRILAHYINKMAHVMSDGYSYAPVAILYHAEAEWSGAYMSAQKPASILAKAPIDYDIISADILEKAIYQNGVLTVGRKEYKVLVLPEAERRPDDLSSTIEKLKNMGMNIIDLNQVKLADLMKEIIDCGCCELEIMCGSNNIRYREYIQDDGILFMLLNVSMSETIETDICINGNKHFFQYDVIKNEVVNMSMPNHIVLSPGQTLLLICPDRNEDVKNEYRTEYTIRHYKEVEELKECKLSLKKFDADSFSDYGKLGHCCFLQNIDDLALFCGRIKFTYIIQTQKSRYSLECLGVSEGCKVKLDGTLVGTIISYPYEFDLGIISAGSHLLEIELDTTLALEMRDRLSQFAMIKPAGLKNVYLKAY